MKTARKYMRVAAAGIAGAVMLIVVPWVALQSRVDTTPRDTIGTTSRPLSAGQSPDPFRFHWPVGRSYTYRIDWRTVQSLRLDRAGVASGRSKPIEAETELVAHLVLTAERQTEAGCQLRARFEAPERHKVVVVGQKALPDAMVAAVLTTHQARVEADETGRFGPITFDESAPPLFKHLMQWALTQAQVVVPQGALASGEWTVKLPGLHGEGPVEYAVLTREPRLVRIRTAYGKLHALPQGGDAMQRLDDTTEVRLDPKGHLDTLDQTESLFVERDNETILSAQTHFRLELVAINSADRVPPAQWGRVETRMPGAPTVSAGMRQKLLEQRTGGMTGRQLLDDLRLLSFGGVLPDRSRWVWQAVGLLRLEPERCAELAELFVADDTSHDARSLIADLLAAAGHGDAQAALRRALDSRAARADGPAHALLFQRLAFVDRPDAESIAYIARAYEGLGDEPDAPHLRYAAAYTLGSATRRLALAGEIERVEPYMRRLHDDLLEAQHPEERAHLLEALGNAGREEDLETILDAAHAEAPQVRRAAASALRKIDTGGARTGLIALAADSEVAVQAQAFAALDRHHLDDQALRRLAAVVTTGAVHAVNRPLVVTLLARRAEGSAPVDAMLARIEADAGDDPRLRARIRRIRDRA